MMRKTTIALFALAAVGLTQPTAAFARGGDGGGGCHGSRGGGHGGAVASIAARRWFKRRRLPRWRLSWRFRERWFHGGGFHRGGFHRREFATAIRRNIT